MAFILGKNEHPEYEWLTRKSGNVVRQEADYAELKINYQGVPPLTDQRTYRTTGATNSDPIESHVDFASVIGGTQAAPLNSAIFDDTGKFTGFASGSAHFGTKSYLSPGLKYEETWVLGVFTGAYALEALGDIDTPPSSFVLPSVRAGANLMLTGGSAEPVGGAGGKIVREWRLSGRGGWNGQVYTT